jgi:hypothetical protein
MKGNAAQTKVHLKGKDEDFIVMVDSKDAVLNWKKDKSIPLAQVVSGWKVFVTHRYVLSYFHHLQSAARA